MKLLAVHGPGDVRLDDYVRPDHGPEDVVVRMKACGICGSDLSYIKIGGIPGERETTPLGHEGAGEVLHVGSAVSGISVGDRVIVNPMMTPSNIGSGGPEGAFTPELLVREARLGDAILPIPEGIPYDIAAMCEPLAVALHSVNRAAPQPDEKVAVFGCGPIGLGVILWLADHGVTDIVALDLAPERRERALAMGARVALDPASGDLLDLLGACHGSEACMNRMAVGTDLFIDVAGATSVPGDIVKVSKRHSRLVVSAVYFQPVALPLIDLLMSEMTLTTAIGYPNEMPDVIAAMPRLKDKIAAMISHRLSFAQVMEGLKVAATPQSAKVMIEF